MNNNSERPSSFTSNGVDITNLVRQFEQMRNAQAAIQQTQAHQQALLNEIGALQNRVAALQSQPTIPVGGTTDYFGNENLHDPNNLIPLPRNFMLCNGNWLLESEYPELFRVIGHLYDDGIMRPGYFRLPDTRGKIIHYANTAAENPAFDLPLPQLNGTALPQHAVGSTAGSVDFIIGGRNLPPHVHSADAINANHRHAVHLRTSPYTHAHTTGSRYQQAHGGQGFDGWGFESNSKPGYVDRQTTSDTHFHDINGDTQESELTLHVQIRDNDRDGTFQAAPISLLPPIIVARKLIRVR